MGPDQRFLGVLDTSPFRIAIVYSIVFAIGAAALIYAVDFAVSRVVDGSTDNLIEAEVQGLREQMLVLSRNDFIELVVPELQRRGLFRTEYEGHTLREHLGLPRPASRHVSPATDLAAD